MNSLFYWIELIIFYDLINFVIKMQKIKKKSNHDSRPKSKNVKKIKN